MSRLLAVWMFTLLAFTLFSQQIKITGAIVGSDNEPISFANVYLKQDTALISGVFSNEEGEFTLQALPGIYELNIDFIGYTSYRDTLNIENDLNVGDIIVVEGGENLDQILISEYKNEMKAGIDKKVIYISEDLRRSNNNVSELLEMVPIVNMDFEGTPSIPGKIGVVILVDGREPKMRADNLGTVLKLIPSDQVVAIEIMTNPPAKYTKSNAAVINIVTNKAPQTGSLLNLGARYDDQDSRSVNANFTHKNGRFSNSLWGGRWGNNSQSEWESRMTNLLNDEVHQINRITLGDYKGHGIYGGWAPEYEIDSQLIVSPYIGYYEWNNDNSSRSSYNILNSDNQMYDNYKIEGNGVFSGGGIFSGLELFKYFDEAEKELSLDIGLDFFKNEQFSDNFLRRTTLSDIQRYSNESRSSSIEFDLEFFDPIDSTSNYSFDLELEFELPAEETQRTLLGESEDLLVLDSNQSFENEESSFSQELSFNYSKNFNRTGVSFDLGQFYFKYDNLYDQSVVVDNSFFYLIPKVSVSQKLGEISEIGLSYRYGNNIPGSWYINPNRRITVDSVSVSFGNPNLKPERSHEVEMNYGFYLGKFNIGATAFWRKNINTINNFTRVNEDGVFLNSYENNGSLTNTGSQIAISGSLGQKVKLNLSGSIFNSSLSRNDINESTTSYNVNGRVDLFLPNRFRFSLNSRYNGPELDIQGKTEGYGVLGANLKRGFFNDKLNVTVQYNDILRSQNYERNVQQQNFISYSLRKYLSAQLQVRLSYRIGNLKEKPKSSKSQ